MTRQQNTTDAILNSFNGVQRAKAKPFMHTRIMARMQRDEKSAWGQAITFLAKPLVAITCVCSVIAANVFFVIMSENRVSEPTAVSVPYTIEEYLQGENLVLAVNDFDNNE